MSQLVMSLCKASLSIVWLLFTLSAPAIAQDSGLFGERTSLSGISASSQPARFYWQNQPLSQGLAALEEAFQISIWLDRQIDPSTRVSYRDSASTNNASLPLIEAISAAVKSIGADASLIENVIYVGPTNKGARLQRMAHELAKDKKLRKVKPMKWAELASYNDVAKDALRLTGVRLRGSLPHDLLHERQLKRPLTAATQLTLLAGGFDLEFRSRGRSLEIVPLSKSSTVDQSYQSDQLKTTSRDELLSIAESLGLKTEAIQQQDGNVRLRGPATLHLRLLALDGVPKQPGGKKVFTFSVEGQVAERIIMDLAVQIGFRVEWDPQCVESLRQKRIDLSANKATLDEVLARFSKQLNLQHEFKQGTVRFFPK